jgi:hypothetical protein
MRRQGMAMDSHGTDRGRQVRVSAVGGVLIAVLGLAGCGGEGPAPVPSGTATSGTASPGGTSGGSARAAEPGRQATAYPVAASATAQALPSLGSRTAGGWTLTLNGVRRSGKDSVVVTAMVTNASSRKEAFHGVSEEGYSIRTYADGKYDGTHEFSAVTLTVDGSAVQYQVMRDSKGYCACSQGLGELLEPGQSIAVYAYVTAPPEAATVTVTVQGFAPFTGVRVLP